jgi:intracellular septation protein
MPGFLYKCIICLIPNTVNKNISKNFFLISFLPAIAYWYLEENYPLKVALMGGLFLAVVEITLEKYFTKHVHTLSKFNFILILFLGAISFIGEEGVWFKLRPVFTGLGISSFMIYKLKTSNGLMSEMMEGMPKKNVRPPVLVLRSFETHFIFFTLCYSGLMCFLAITQTTKVWALFNTIGFYISFFVFLIIEVFLMRKKLKQHALLNNKRF